MQWVSCKVNVTPFTYFARDPLRSYFDESQKNEIYLSKCQKKYIL